MRLFRKRRDFKGPATFTDREGEKPGRIHLLSVLMKPLTPGVFRINYSELPRKEGPQFRINPYGAGHRPASLCQRSFGHEGGIFSNRVASKCKFTDQFSGTLSLKSFALLQVNQSAQVDTAKEDPSTAEGKFLTVKARSSQVRRGFDESPRVASSSSGATPGITLGISVGFKRDAEDAKNQEEEDLSPEDREVWQLFC